MIPAANFLKNICLIIFSFSLFGSNLQGQVKFCAVGDILLDRGVRTAIEKNGSIYYPFQAIQPTIQTFDLALCNLECSITSREVDQPLFKRYSFRGEPEYLAGLKWAGFNLASVANNHTIDWGKSGFLETIANLQSFKILPIGGGRNQAEALLPQLVEKNDETFAIFGSLEFLLEATVFLADQPYPAFAEIDKICAVISEYNNYVDHVIITFHWGIENNFYPTSRQIEYAHRVIDAGADLVIGHHPHVLQPVEIYQNKIILYSLGNFVFDNSQEDQRRSVIFGCEFFAGKIINPQLLPLEIFENQPAKASQKVAQEIYSHFQTVSQGFNVKFKFDNRKISILPENSEEYPVKEIFKDSLKFIFFKSRINISMKDRIISQYALPDSAYNIIEASLVSEDGVFYLYSIVERVDQQSHRRIAVFSYDLQNNKFLQPALDGHKDFNPWKIISSDIDFDGNPDLLVGVFKSTRYDSIPRKRIFVYNREKIFIYPKWFGSRLSHSIVDFKTADINSDQRDELITLEYSEQDNKYKIMSYLWNGFGFDNLQELDTFDYFEAAKTGFKLLNREFARF